MEVEVEVEVEVDEWLYAECVYVHARVCVRLRSCVFVLLIFHTRSCVFVFPIFHTRNNHNKKRGCEKKKGV